jgi:RNA polymerase sigma-70 factor (ECF subfamily)
MTSTRSNSRSRAVRRASPRSAILTLRGARMSEDQTDEALLRAWSERGDRAALDRLVRAVWPEAFRLAHRCLGDAAAAEDAAQEACARLTRAKAEVGEAGSVRRWFRTIVLNVVRNHVRARGRRSAHEARAAGRRAERIDAADALEAEELRSRLRDLPAELQEPLVLHFWGDLPHREVAETLGLSKSTTTWRIQRGLETLRAALSASAALAPLEALEAALRAVPAPAAPPPPTAHRLLRRVARVQVAAGLVAAALLAGAALLFALPGGADGPAPAPRPPAPPVARAPGGAMAAPSVPPAPDARPPEAGQAAPTTQPTTLPAPQPGGRTIEQAPATPGPGRVPEAVVVVSGRVLEDARSQPLAGADVTAFVLALDRWGSPDPRLAATPGQSASGRTGPDGAFRLELPAPTSGARDMGTLLVARAPGRATFVRKLPPPRRTGLDLVLSPGGLALRGVVVGGDGRPLAGLRLRVELPLETAASGRLFGEAPPPPDEYVTEAEVSFDLVSGSDGRFALDGLPSAREASVSIRPGQGSLGQVEGPTAVAPAELRLVATPAARLAVRVLDATDRPVVGAVVDLVDGQAAHGSFGRAVTDAEGRCAFDSLWARSYRARVRLPRADGSDRAPVQASLATEVREGDAREVTIRLGAERARLAVRVVDPSGAPRARVDVVARVDGVGGEGHVRGTSDARGEVTFDELTPSTYLLYASQDREALLWFAQAPDEYVRGTAVVLGADGASVTLTLAPEPVLRGRVVDAAGAPAEGAAVSVMRRAPGGRGGHAQQQGTTDAAGRFDCGSVAEEVVSISVSAAGHPEAEVQLDRAALLRGEPVEVRLAAGGQLAVSARIVSPVPDGTAARAFLVNGSGSRGVFGKVAGGRVELVFEHLKAGTRGTLFLRVDGFVHVTQPVAAGQSSVAWDGLALERGRTLRGRAIDAAGAPARDATVFFDLPGDGDQEELPTTLYSQEEVGRDGRFVLAGVPAGRFTVTVLGTKRSATVEVDTVTTSDLGDLVLRGKGDAAPGEATPESFDALRVTVTDPAGPLAKAGLRTGDLIVKIMGKSFSGPEELDALFGPAMAAGKLELEVLRGAERLRVEVPMAEGRPGGDLAPAKQ